MSKQREKPNYRLNYHACFYDPISGSGSRYTKCEFSATDDESARKIVRALVEESHKIGPASALRSSVCPVSLERLAYVWKEVEETEKIEL